MAYAITFQTKDAQRYGVLRSIGRGGMGAVFLVGDRDLNRQIAIKVAGSPQVHGRFTEEVGILGQLEHPNIVPLHDVGRTAGDEPFCTMRYVRGQDLATVIRSLRQDRADASFDYSLTRLMQIFVQVTQAIAYAHSRGVVHRDLKPANVMLGEHGEVQVVDWGLAKVVARDDDRTTQPHVSRPAASAPARFEVAATDRSLVHSDPAAALTQEGSLVGTPHYMAPEQAAGARVDLRTDVWSLGVLLYELLTLERPFAGTTVAAVLDAVQHGRPTSPHLRAPARNVPPELEQACLGALEPDPERRTPSANAVGEQVQLWLEASADREKRFWLAESKVRTAREGLAEYRRLREAASRLRKAIREATARYRSWQPVADKVELYRREDELQSTRARAAQLSSVILSQLTAALEHDSNHGEARALLADYYWDRLVEAEARGDEAGTRFVVRLVERHHGGRYTRELRGDGALWLVSDPPGAEVQLFPLTEHQLQRVPGRGRGVGHTPIGPIPLPRGSYLAVLSLRGHHPVSYPIFITRNREWRGGVQLHPTGTIPDDFILVPESPFLAGGDLRAGTSLRRQSLPMASFLIARHPVTMGEYLEFLNRIDRDRALVYAPRHADGAPTYLTVVDGRFTLPADPNRDPTVDLRMPATGISWYDASAYCSWRSERDGRRYRLPSELEWEKAARGVDGRWFPWGDRFDHSLCNIRGSRRAAAGAVPVDDFGTDVSIYGVRGMAGNMRDWTATGITEAVITEEGMTAPPDDATDDPTVMRVVRGGAWFVPVELARSANRDWFLPNLAGDTVASFRLALDAPRTEHSPGPAQPRPDDEP